MAVNKLCDLVKAYAEGLGLKATDFGAILRAGFLTSAVRHGASVFKMRDVNRASWLGSGDLRRLYAEFAEPVLMFMLRTYPDDGADRLLAAAKATAPPA